MKKNSKIKNQIRIRRHRRVRAKIIGTAQRPRLSVFRSLHHINAQLIDDQVGRTLVSARDQEIKISRQNNKEKAQAVGHLLAERALAKNFQEVVFDKGHYQYHGRVKALAEGAREGGLKF